LAHVAGVSKNERFDFDVAIIGGGSGGYAAARTAAAEGLRTVVIEGGKEVGGLCILRGCMPTKALLYASEVMNLVSHPGAWGIRTEGVSFDFAKVMARKNSLIGEFANYRVEQLNSGKFKFIRAMARFVNAHTVELSTGGKLTAKNFVIATGSQTAPPPLPQLRETSYLTSDDALELKRLPKSIVVLGGGPIACEFAQFFARFGVKVTVVQRSSRLLTGFDTDCGAELEKVFQREGIALFTETKLLDARRLGNLKEVSFEHAGKTVRVQAEEILYALGRVPNTASLGLEQIGVRLERGCIGANTRMQTNLPHIYAAGDCTGLHEIVHIAVQQGETAALNIARGNRAREMDYRLRIEVVFTDPHIALVGITEKEASLRDIPYLKASFPFNDHGKSLIMGVKEGFVKLLADPKAGEIIGGACVGPSGGELIHEIVAAMAKRMTVHELATMPHYHPTLAEIWTYPAEELAEKVGSNG
jgi:pyruvate/2-oxoglutarate dehydrogenase complex dihydrolipoamide dehydrogenase (E3) component